MHAKKVLKPLSRFIQDWFVADTDRPGALPSK